MILGCFIYSFEKSVIASKHAIKNPVAVAYPVAQNFVLHPFIVGVLEVLRLGKFCKAQRRHDSFGLMLCIVQQIRRPVDSFDHDRGAG